MGMNKCHVNDYEQILAEFERLGIDRFANKYIKYDAIIGESRAIEFIENKIKEYKSKLYL